MRRILWAMIVLLIGWTDGFLAVGAAELKVDFGSIAKPVDHAASGSLYGIAAEGWPEDRWISAIHPKNFTQMAPGGGQLANGETAPVGDALIVAPIAERHGATVTIRMPDSFAQFPYIYKGDADWLARVKAMVARTVKADPPNIYAYEIWNEPDWNWKDAWGEFDAFWQRTHAAIREQDDHRAIMGPSISRWNQAWMRRFLRQAKADGALPEIVSWHELDPREANDLTRHFGAYRALERELGIGPLPVSINEYGAPRDSAVPGALTRLVARLERAGTDTADLAFWHKPGRLGDLIAPVAGGRGPATTAAPNGAFWVFKWYGDMKGVMLTTVPDSMTGPTLDGFASYDAGDRTIRIVAGGEDGDHRIVISGLGEWFSPRVDVQVYAARWTGTDGTQTAPEPLFQRVLPIKDAAVAIHLANATFRDAFLILVTPTGKGAAWTAPVKHFSTRLEAEDAKLSGARKFPVRMAPGNFFAPTVSGNAYVGLLDRQNASIAFTATVPAAGKYELSFGYSNGLADAAIYEVDVSGSAPVDLTFTPTQFRELIDQAKLTVDLPAGAVTIRLKAGPRSPHMFAPSSLIEIDYLDVTGLEPETF